MLKPIPFKLFIVLVVLFSFSCNNKPVTTQIDSSIDSCSVVVINNWQILGPFKADMDSNSFDVDNLKQYGHSEAAIDYNDFKNISPTGSFIKNQAYKTDTCIVDFNELYNYTNDSTISGNVYSMCIIESDKNRKLKLNFTSDDGAKVWLNGKLIHSHNKIGDLVNYENYFDLDLDKGGNQLLVKVNNGAYGWKMFATIEKGDTLGEYKHHSAFELQFGNYLLDASNPKNEIKLNPNLPNGGYILKITDGKSNLVTTGTIENCKMYSFPVDSLETGVYTAELEYKGRKYDEKFFVGGLIEETGKLLTKVKGFKMDKETAENVHSYDFRFNHLQKPENVGYGADEKRDWYKKIINIYSILDKYHKYLEKGTKPETKLTGGLIKTFKSKIDGGPQYYQLFVPKGYNGEPLPMVAEMPKFMKMFDHPLKSYHFANIKLFEQFEDLANRYNIIVLDPDCRTTDHANKNAIDEAAFWEVLEDVKMHYNIDTTRIYLRGACLSARMALKLATKHPRKFAAVSLTSPISKLRNADNSWVKQNEPTYWLKNLSNMPILNIHCINDWHSPIQTSKELNWKVEEAGLTKYTYIEDAITLKEFYSAEYLDYIFDWLTRQKVNNAPAEVQFSTYYLKYNKAYWLKLDEIASPKKAEIDAKVDGNTITVSQKNIHSYSIDLSKLSIDPNKKIKVVENGTVKYDSVCKQPLVTISSNSNKQNKTKKTSLVEGPFADVFNKPFIVVKGTNCDKNESYYIDNMVNIIAESWAKKYFIKCRIKNDSELTQKDIKENSLIIVGTKESNTAYKLIQEEIPVAIDKNSITILGKEYVGKNLCYYMVFPNLQSKENYIAIVGYNNYKNFNLVHESSGSIGDISDWGWYDYRLWDGENSKEAATGYFNRFWEL